MTTDSVTHAVVTLVPHEIRALKKYKQRRKNEEYFEIEELFEILDNLADCINHHESEL